MSTYKQCIPLVKQLDHNDKLRLAQWLITEIAQEEGVNDRAFELTDGGTGLCGAWQDSRSGEEIVQEIISSRTSARDVVL